MKTCFVPKCSRASTVQWKLPEIACIKKLDAGMTLELDLFLEWKFTLKFSLYRFTFWHAITAYCNCILQQQCYCCLSDDDRFNCSLSRIQTSSRDFFHGIFLSSLSDGIYGIFPVLLFWFAHSFIYGLWPGLSRGQRWVRFFVVFLFIGREKEIGDCFFVSSCYLLLVDC